MKKFALSIAALAVSAGAALAADLPSRKGPPVLPPPPPPPPMWTGFYVGLNAGGGWSNTNSVNVATAPLVIDGLGVNPQLAALASGWGSTGSNGGFIGGGQIGYNYQFYNNFVVGIEADIQGIAGSNGGQRSFVSGATVVGVPVTNVLGFSRSIDYFGTVRGRLGWLATPTLLIYGTGGLAYGGVTSNVALLQAGLTNGYVGIGGANFADTRVGWTAGGGVEWMFWPNWSAKAEYLYYDLGSVTQNFGLVGNFAPGAAGGGLFAATQTTTRYNGNVVRAGVNYHFNWGAPAPVVAKY
jgi:outer membrane immunogenic protein